MEGAAGNFTQRIALAKPDAKQHGATEYVVSAPAYRYRDDALSIELNPVAAVVELDEEADSLESEGDVTQW